MSCAVFVFNTDNANVAYRCGDISAAGMVWWHSVTNCHCKVYEDSIIVVSILASIKQAIGARAVHYIVGSFYFHFGTHTNTSFFNISKHIREWIRASLPFGQLSYIIAYMIIFVKNWYGIIYFMANNLFNVKKSKSIFLTKKAIKDKDTRERAILYASTAVNYFFVIFQLYGGIHYGSAWFVALGVYYAVLTSINLYIGLSYKKSGHKAWKVFYTAGWVLALANLALVVMISVMIASPGVAIRNYSPIMAAGATIWAFYLLISAILGIVKHWREKNAIALAKNNMQLIGATVSILMLQTAMIASYGAQAVEEAGQTLKRMSGVIDIPADIEKATNDLVQIFVTSNRVTGVLVIVVVLAITIYMIIKGNREYKKSQK